MAGPLAAGAFVLGGVIAIFTALSASELGTAMPKSGGAYFYINRALGPLFGSIAGWGNWIGLTFASAFYMFGFGQYVIAFKPLLTEIVSAAPFGELVIAALEIPGLVLAPIPLSSAKIIALLGAVFFVAVNYFGAKEPGNSRTLSCLF